ncbi:4'-phosphopantetheinyl transferase superfamily protein [Paenibacillus sp. FSL E2-0190]|uniref:4'-phosphopantetheinyl transferase family protein n=1 Tax=Paenibacillus sp. FSL E2-0190 TaxID=2954504 RepID=UPI0030EBFC81
MNDQMVLKLISTLPAEKQKRINRFVRKEDGIRTLAAEILSRLLICRRLSIKNSAIELEYNHYGKPLIKGNMNLYFNNSHSGEWVVSAISDTPVGTDVERISEINIGIAERFFSPCEFNDLMQKEGEDRLKYFFDLWTLKESYIKAIGIGLSLPLSSFTISLKGDKVLINTQNELNCFFFRQYIIDSGYRLALCSAYDRFPNQVEIVNFNEIAEVFLNYYN